MLVVHEIQMSFLNSNQQTRECIGLLKYYAPWDGVDEEPNHTLDALDLRWAFGHCDSEDDV
ncbi:hypothetical protein D3C86_1491250 [compost metagenome]